MGERLAPLREEGVLIVGSGFTPTTWRPSNTSFDAFAQLAMASGGTESLLRFLTASPDAPLAHPRTEHFAPLFVTLGAVGGPLSAHSVIDGFRFGLSKRSWQVSAA